MGQGTPRYVFEIQGTFSVSDCSNRKKNEVNGYAKSVSQRLAGQAKEVVIVDMTKPVLDSVIKLKDNDIKKIEDVEDIPDEFKNYGKKKEDVQTSEEKAKNWVWTPGK